VAEDLSLVEKVLGVHRALQQAGISHAFGGALALAYYAEPRATADIDINVFLPPGDHDRVAVALGSLGVDASLPRVEQEGQGRVRWGRTPLDLFYSYNPLHDEMAAEVRDQPFGGDSTLPVLAPEHLVVCKAVFDRPKDWVDISEVVATTDFSHSTVTGWLEEIVGADDARTLRFRAVSAEAAGKSGGASA
jgi:hypothetical protein